ENNPDFAATDENAIIVQTVDMPAFHFAGADRELINIDQRGRVNIPTRVQNLTQSSAFVSLGNGAADDNSLDSITEALAFGSYGRRILNRLRPDHSEFLNMTPRKDNSE